MSSVNRTISIFLVMVAGMSYGADKMFQKDVPASTIRFQESEVVWKDAPPHLPKGTKVAVLEGNPKAEGIFTIRIKAPKNMKMEVHEHPNSERVTVLSGVIYVGFGDKYDESIGTSFEAGSYYVNPPHKKHYVFTKDSEAVAQITGIGPWKVLYDK